MTCIERCCVCHTDKEITALIAVGQLYTCPECQDEIDGCYFCEEQLPKDDLIQTDRGSLCPHCFDYLVSRGERVVRIYNDEQE